VLAEGKRLKHLKEKPYHKIPYRDLSIFFFCGEGPRSRLYGHTATLRLLVEPHDEDADDDDFCSFPSNGAPVG
jgi:hypothetical protein